MEKLVAAYSIIVEHLKNNASTPEQLANYVGTPERCARALLETCWSDEKIVSELKQVIGASFPVSRGPDDCGGMITQGPITINSFCPHHLYPVVYSAFVSYIPKDNVLGLSKLSRISKLLGKRPVLHEQLASDIADVLYSDPDVEAEEDSTTLPSIQSFGSAVMLVGTHMCMCSRGVESNARTSVTELRGQYWAPGFEEKFYRALENIKTTNAAF